MSTSNPMPTIQEEAGCFGYYGFGSGWALARGYQPPDGSLYCNMCPIRIECYGEHLVRARELLPELMDMFMEKAKELQGIDLIKWWHEETKDAATGKSPPDPIIAVMLTNMEQSQYLALGMEPARGVFGGDKLTLPLPVRGEDAGGGGA